MMMKSMAPHKVPSIIPAPQSGIKLIEDISQKMHSIKGPVIAMTGAKQLYAPPPQEKSPGPTIPTLTIKPPVVAYGYGYMPREADREVAMDKKTNEESKTRRKAQLVAQGEEGKDRDKGSSYSGDELASAGRRQSSSRWDFAPNNWKKEAPVLASRPEPTSYGRTANDSLARMANGPLGVAVSKFGGALQHAENLQRAAEAGKADATVAKPKAARTEASLKIASKSFWERGQTYPQPGYSNAANVKDARISSAAGSAGMAVDDGVQEQQAQSPPLTSSSYKYNRMPPTNMGKYVGAPGDNQYTQNANNSPIIRDYRGKQIATQSASAAAPAASGPAAPSQTIAMLPVAATFGGAGGGASDQLSGQLSGANFSTFSKKKTEIAMLPPNVITGIPLVRLGSSALDANRALTSVKGNKLKQQYLSGWTVLVLYKANSSEPAMHVYMRHGLVEALRIFDSSFIAPDFGVQLNDDVQTVKAKFGEPAFMLRELDCPTAQNYVYPISQVSFELAKPTNASSPKVVSVLIFTVK
jgi:hypothetical protein